ncbi:16S rRNA (uracil(1498)-N(3))-methyltransferase [Hahella sp. CCB-MM4]|uniref:16S rRNA (uracil(1498)-N(3))-methyltransferase n=1 Tax=Hahella sp. (strain CCB-MM4) TaxID=1926491 RepID=UPI000B9BD784|nr:16S rRNA (uracil(1498)-N(3))-methyltransferase [Hahella sp. CCB-MM4]OZG71863.1 16S rRNA (uracil(1498)-N(3))-methyltransferase [Hahella sp. CCB-MM4]
MRTIRVHCNQPLNVGNTIMAGPDIANYVGRVLRLKPNDQIRLFNGEGFDVLATIKQVERKDISLSLEEKIELQNESPIKITLGQVVSRGDRMDYAIQKAVELGVNAIAPLTSERCEVRLDDNRKEKRRGHWQQVVVSACEQSGRAVVPQVTEIASVDDWLNSIEAELKLILHPHDKPENVTPLWQDNSRSPASIALLIGPEGGFSEDEVSLAESRGFKRLCLGPRVLRTETAPVAGLTYLQCAWGDFQLP